MENTTCGCGCWSGCCGNGAAVSREYGSGDWAVGGGYSWADVDGGYGWGPEVGPSESEVNSTLPEVSCFSIISIFVLYLLINKKAVLSQGEPRDAAVDFE